MTGISGGAFRNCSTLTSIAIPSGVTSIGGYSFDGCSGLIDAYYGGTLEEWTQIQIS